MALLAIWSVAIAGTLGAEPPDPSEALGEPHPWIASAPPEFARKIEAGSVRIRTDDAALAAAKKQGLTVFHLQSRYRFRYVAPSGNRTPDNPRQLQARFAVRVLLDEVGLEHAILLTESFQPDRPWMHPLVRHEFDHVSVSTDPRLKKIIRKVLSAPVWVATQWPQGSRPDSAAIETAVNEQMNARIAELERLVQTHYDWLDAESASGTANLLDRSRFFLELYSRERLERCRFEYLDLLRGTAHDTSDKEVLEHYLFLEPS